MSKTIRRQSILSSLVIYFGFAIGFLNTYFFTKQGFFTTDQYGLITLVTSSIVPVMASVAGLAMPSYIYKFYPYYNDNLKQHQNDMLTRAVVIGLLGVLIFGAIGFAVEGMVYRKYNDKSPLFVKYYYWTFIMGLGLTLYNILEAYAWSLHKSVLTNYLKEVQWRLFTTVIVVLFIAKVIPDFNSFIKLYFFSFLSIALTLLGYLLFTGKVRITFTVSRVTKKFIKKITKFCFFVYAANLVFTLSLAFDVIVIAAAIPGGGSKAAIFGLAQIMTSVIQAPQRGIVAASIPHLSKSWKDKNLLSIKKIYERSSINMLIFASGIFILIALNYTDAITTFRINNDYLLGFQAFIFLGLTRVVDMGTGVNAQIIGTSNYWKFELFCGVGLLALTMPLTYYMALKMDILGPAVAQLISVTVYNIIRIVFLYKKYKLLPFTAKTFYTIIIAVIAYGIPYFLFKDETGVLALIIRSITAITLFAGGVWLLKLTPDILPVLESVQQRNPFKRKR